MKAKTSVFVILVAALLLGGVIAGVSLTKTVGVRITFVDFKAVYPNLQDFNEGRTTTAFGPGPYPSISDSVDYHFATPRGSMQLLHCSFDDFNSWINSRKP